MLLLLYGPICYFLLLEYPTFTYHCYSFSHCCPPGVGRLQALLGPGRLRRSQTPARAQPGHLAAWHSALQQVGASHISSSSWLLDHLASWQIPLPDQTIFPSADGNYEVTIMTKAILNWNGKVLILCNSHITLYNYKSSSLHHIVLIEWCR